MKKVLILINSVLILLLALSVWGALTDKKNEKTEAVSTRTAPNSKQNAPASNSTRRNFQWPSSAESVSIITRKNVFNPQRGGFTGGRGVVTYSLVGIFRVGKVQGAIILTKGAPAGAAPIKQRFMLGETLPNGYVLEQIQNNQVTLVNGSSRMVLTQALPSENFPSGGGQRRQPNQMQQMLDLMRQSLGLQQRQNMNMMQMMRNNQNNNLPQRGGSSNGRRR